MIELTYWECLDRYGDLLGSKVWARQEAVRKAREAAKKEQGDDSTH